jgi:hypothetical protein
MKPFFSIIVVGSLTLSVASAQNVSSEHQNAEPAFSMEAVTPPGSYHGNINYQLASSAEDLNKQNFILYTDSNATVAYIKINRTAVRLTGGPNPENIMTYLGSGYTVTLRVTKKYSTIVKGNSDDEKTVKIDATLVIYDKSGKAVGEKATGCQITPVKN